MPYTVEIRRNADGLVRKHECEDDWSDQSDFDWFENNRACDCTRAELFANVAGESDPNRECGSSLYAVRIIGPGGVVLGEDEAWTQLPK